MSHWVDISRIVLKANGVEWFIYNRTPAYDYLKTELDKLDGVDALHLTGIGGGFDRPPAASKPAKKPSSNNDSSSQEDANSSLWLKILPIEFQLDRGAIVIGNREMPSIVVVDWQSGRGVYHIKKSMSVLDRGKYVLDMKLDQPKLQLRTNIDFKGGTKFVLPHKPSNSIARMLFNLWVYFKRIPGTGADNKRLGTNADRAEWHGLTRYLNQNNKELKRAISLEDYAKVTSIVDSKRLDLSYYSDDAGVVPKVDGNLGASETENMTQKQLFDQANGGESSPEWGLDLRFTHNIIHYGPWADRQRTVIHSFFYPFAYRTFPVTTKPQPSELRVYPDMVLNIDLVGETTWRVPTREISKDWKYGGAQQGQGSEESTDRPNMEAQEASGASARPYGWLDFKFDEGAVLKTSIPMILGQEGYSIVWDAHAPSLQILSSLNYAPLMTAKDFKFRCDMQTPLVWNNVHLWTFDLNLQNPAIFLLRDHVTLFQDLVYDWTNRPGLDLDHFIPYEYQMNLDFSNMNWYFCANEGNVISQPNDTEDNTFLIFETPRFSMTSNMVFDEFEPMMSSYPFEILMECVKVRYSPPNCSTLGAFLKSECRDVASMGQFHFTGDYVYNMRSGEVQTCPDIMNVSMNMSQTHVKMYGFLYRALLLLQANYAGPSMNFVTLDEYRQRLQHPSEIHVSVNPNAPISMLEISIVAEFNAFSLEFPEVLFDHGPSSVLKMDELLMDMRMTDDYMSVQMDTSPWQWIRQTTLPDPLAPENLVGSGSVRSDGMHLHAYRLNGPAPKYLYYCSDFELNFGQIEGEVTPSFLMGLHDWFTKFNFHSLDVDNALDAELNFINNPNPEVMFAQALVSSINVIVWCGPADCVDFSCSKGMRYRYDSLVDHHYLNRGELEIPHVALRILTRGSDVASKDVNWLETGFIETAAVETFYSRSSRWKEEQNKQRRFLEENDAKTRRCGYLYGMHNDVVNDDNIFRDHRVFRPSIVVHKMRGVDDRIFSDMNRIEFDYVNVAQLLLESDDAFWTDTPLSPSGSTRNSHVESKSLLTEFSDLVYGERLRQYSLIVTEDSMVPRFVVVNPSSERIEPVKRSKMRFYSADEIPRFEEGIEKISTSSIEFVKSIKGLVTPKLSQESVDPHLMLDTLELRLAQSLHTDQRLSIFGHTIVLVPNIDIKVIQESIMLKRDLYKPPPSKPKSPKLPYTEMHVIITQFTLNSLAGYAKQSSVASMNSLAVVLASEVNDMAVDNNSVLLSPLEVTSRYFQDKGDPNQPSSLLDLLIGDVEATLEEDRLCAVISGFRKWIQVWASIDRSRMSSSSDLLQNQQALILGLAHHSRSRDIGDPIFMTRPSNLWRLKTKPYQGSDDWKLIMHLRHTMAGIEKSEFRLFNGQAAGLQSKSMLAEVLDCFKPWRPWDIGDLAVSELLGSIYVPKKAKSIGLSKMELSMDSVLLHILHGPSGDVSSFSTYNIDAYYDARTGLIDIEKQQSRKLHAYNCHVETAEAKVGDSMSPFLSQVSDLMADLSKLDLPIEADNEIPLMEIFGIFMMDRLSIQAHLGDMMGKLELLSLRHALGVAMGEKQDSSSQSIALSKITLNMTSTKDDSVAKIDVTRPQAFISDSTQKKLTKTMVKLPFIEFNIPGSVFKLYTHHYDQGISKALTSLSKAVSVSVESLQSSAASFVGMPKPVSVVKDHQMSVLLKEGIVRAEIMPSLKLQYGLYGVMPHVNLKHSDEKLRIDYTVTIQKQNLLFLVVEQHAEALPSQKPSTFSFPQVGINGQFDTRQSESEFEGQISSLKTTVKIDPITVSLGVEMLDRLLTSHLVFSSDVSDLINLVNSRSQTRDVESPRAPSRFTYAADMNLDNVRVILEAPLTSTILEFTNLSGRIFSGPDLGDTPRLNLAIKSLRVSLIKNDVERFAGRSNLMGQIDLEMKLQNHVDKNIAPLTLYIQRIGSLIHPLAPVEAIRFLLYYRRELTRRKQSKSKQISRMRDDAKRILQSFGVATTVLDESTKLSSFEYRILVGPSVFCIPLDLTQGFIDLLSKKESPAFVMFIKKTEVYGKSAALKGFIHDFGFQVIDRFDFSGLPGFSTKSYPETNRVLIPMVKIYDGQVKGHAKVEIPSFIAHITPALIRYIKILQGITAQTEAMYSTVVAAQENHTDLSHSNSNGELLKARFHVGGGKVSLRNNDSRETVGRRYSNRMADTTTFDGLRVDLACPSITAKLTARSMPKGSTMHFLVDIAAVHNSVSSDILKLRDLFARELAIAMPHEELTPTPNTSMPRTAIHRETSKSFVTVLVLIKEFRLDLNCLPNSKVESIIGLKDGKFYISNLGESFNITGIMKGCSYRLQHQFAAEECIGITASQVDVSLTTIEQPLTRNTAISGIIHIHDVIGKHNVRQLQDFLIVQHVWRGLLSINASPKPASDATLAFKSAVSVKISRVDLVADMTQAIGKLSFKLENMKLRLRQEIKGSVRLSMSSDVLEVRSEGRLNGIVAGMVSPQIFYERRQPFMDRLTDAESSFFKASFSIQRMLTLLDFNMERIAVFDFDPATISLKDCWQKKDSVHVDVDLEIAFNHIYGILSKNSLPCFMILHDKFAAIIDEKRSLVANSVNAALFKRMPSATVALRSETTSLSIFRTGKFSIRVVDVQLALFKENFDPGQDCVQIKCDKLDLDFTRFVPNEDIQRQTTLDLGGHTIVKKCLKKEQKSNDQNIAQWTITQWNDHIASRQFKIILDLPPTDISMESTQQLTESLVEYIFTTEFSGAIDINLNIAFLKFLQDIASDFGDQFSRTVKELREFLKSKRGENDYQKGDNESGSTHSTGSNSASNSATVKLSNEQLSGPQPIVFRAIQPIVLEPQLKVIDGATPNDVLSWIGIQRDALPASLHSGVTLTLERLLLTAMTLVPKPEGVQTVPRSTLLKEHK